MIVHSVLYQILNRKNLLIAFLLITSISSRAQQLIQDGEKLYLSNTLIVKVDSGIFPEQLTKALTKVSVTNTKELYPTESIFKKGDGSVNLGGIYLVEYNTTEDPLILAEEVAGMPGVLWAEPKYIRKVCYTPVDSFYSIGEQENLMQINAPSAWDITKGDKKIIIGIVDTGVDWLHPDLVENIYKENDSLVPGSDLGGDIVRPDNDPSEDINTKGLYHGTAVAGIASAVSDNTIGIASIGFRCSILPVKASVKNYFRNDGLYILYGAEGIKWAADHGAKVINCSWGGYGYSAYEQSVIDYAISKGAVVVAAQGNDGSNADFYPANYNGVLSVGWLDTGPGVKTINKSANYGKKVAVFAPGSYINTTWQRPEQISPGIYGKAYGSSASAPHVSGLAGLLWSVFPDYTPKQIVERIRATSDLIDDYNDNSLKNLLGHGVINASRAVDKNVIAVSVRAEDIRFIDHGNGDKNFTPGEEVSIKMKFINYLSGVDNITIKLATTDEYTVIENGTFNTGSMGTHEIRSNELNAFKFKVAMDVPNNHTVSFLLQFIDGAGYTDFQWFDVEINKYNPRNLDFTIQTGKIILTMSSKGDLGFSDYPNNLVGKGFKYKTYGNLLYEGSFMYGTGPLNLMDAAHIKDQKSTDFVPKYSPTSQYWKTGNFLDSGAGSSALGILTTIFFKMIDNNYIIEYPMYQNSVIMDCILKNDTGNNIDSLYVGYYFDWDIPESNHYKDTTYFDNENKIAVTYNTTDSNAPFTGVGLVSDPKESCYYAIDNDAITGEIIFNDETGFSDSEKWHALSNGADKASGKSGNISYVISSGPYSILPGKRLKIAFAITAGSTLKEVTDAVRQSRLYYGAESWNIHEQHKLEFQLHQNYPNPFNPSTTISFSICRSGYVKLKVYNILGQEVATLLDGFLTPQTINIKFDGTGLPSGVYVYCIEQWGYIISRKMLLLR